MSKAIDAMLLQEMSREDIVEAVTDDNSMIDTLYDLETGDAFSGSLFSSFTPEDQYNPDN